MSSLGLLVSLLLPLAAPAPLAAPPLTPAGQPSRGLVIVLRPAEVDERTRTALARVTGELTAAHFRVNVLPLDPAVDPTSQVESVSPDSNAVAAFAIAHPPESSPDIVAIWVCDRLGRRTTIQRMAMHGDDISKDAEALALEAIELIRVSIAGLWPNPAHAGANDSARSNDTPPPSVEPRVQFGVGLGVAMLRDPNLSTSNWMATAAGSVTWPGGWGLRLALAGFGSAETIQREAGSANIHHQMASLGPLWTLWTGERGGAWLSAGVGFDHVAADGVAPDAMRARSASGWVMTIDGGIGGALALGGGVSVTAELDAVVATRPLVLRIDGIDTAAFTRPGVLMAVRLQATF
jgi:hypothetical protein